MDEEIELLGAMFDDELEDDDELGARSFGRYSRGRSRGGSRALSARKRNYVRKISPVIPGVPSAGARNYPLGFGVALFGAATATSILLQASPQRPFKGHRLVVDAGRTGASATGLVTITALNVGQNNQLVSGEALPAEAFAANSFGTGLSLDPATPGITIALQLAISALPTGTDTVAVSAMLIGNTIG